jgi:hypothetical protein
MQELASGKSAILWEMGDGRWEMGDGRWEMGDGRWMDTEDATWLTVVGDLPRYSVVNHELGESVTAPTSYNWSNKTYPSQNMAPIVYSSSDCGSVAPSLRARTDQSWWLGTTSRFPLPASRPGPFWSQPRGRRSLLPIMPCTVWIQYRTRRSLGNR